MTTAYTSALGLALPETGDLSGTWGDVVNNYITEYLDAAIAKTQTLASDSDATLTINNGTALNSTSAQYAAINCTGARTAVRNITLPLSSRNYLVFNNTTGGYAVSAGGVTVYNGERCIIAYDPALAAYAKVASNLHGTTQAPGTNNTTLATTAFVQAAGATLAASAYPVGSIYMNASSAVNPATLLGFGTWVSFGAGRVLVGFDASNALFDSVEETGGSYDATLPSHTHTGSTGNQSVDHTHTFTTDSAGAHQHGTNLPYANAYEFYGGAEQPAVAGPGAGIIDGYVDYNTTSAGAHTHSGTTSGTSAGHTHTVTVDAAGTSATNANIQPYITVYMWKRTA